MDHPTTARPPAPETLAAGGGCRCGLWVVASPDIAQIGRCIELSAGEELLIRRGDGRGGFADPWISQRHATVRARGSGEEQRLELEDHGATNGVRMLRGAPGLLRQGDGFRCGATVLLFDCGSEVSEAGGLVGASAELRVVREEIAMHGPQAYPVHIHGESGVGKEVVARGLHESSARSGRFVSLNVAALPDNLAEAELFGTVPGAFTGARQRAGLVVEADGGTLLLDEIAELVMPMQAKLLRVLDDYAVRPLGSNDSQTVDARLVTATHRDLEEHVEAGSFRQDLFWRLAVTTIEVPPLRERPLDIIPLFTHFYQRCSGPDLLALCAEDPQRAWAYAELVGALLGYHWPGNARELEREAERAAASVAARRRAEHPRPIPPPEKCLGARVLEGAQRRPASSGQVSPSEQPTPEVPSPEDVATLREALRSRERLIEQLEQRTGGNKRAFALLIASVLGIKESTARRNIYRLLRSKEGDEAES